MIKNYLKQVLMIACIAIESVLLCFTFNDENSSILQTAILIILILVGTFIVLWNSYPDEHEDFYIGEDSINEIYRQKEQFKASKHIFKLEDIAEAKTNKEITEDVMSHSKLCIALIVATVLFEDEATAKGLSQTMLDYCIENNKVTIDAELLEELNNYLYEDE